MNRETTHIFLAGGGDAEDSKLLDEQFIKTLNLTKPLIYIPNAKRSESYQSYLEWFRSVMTQFGVTAIEMWDNLSPHHSVDGIAGVYIGGGDTVKLLKEIREAGFDEYLREVARNGIPLYGGSAGAIILGENIRTAPEANKLAASRTVGLRLIKGYSIDPHYKPSDRKTIMKLSKTLHQSIIAIPEKAGGYVTGRTLTNYGTESIAIIQENKVNTINPSNSIELKAQMNYA